MDSVNDECLHKRALKSDNLTFWQRNPNFTLKILWFYPLMLESYGAWSESLMGPDLSANAERLEPSALC